MKHLPWEESRPYNDGYEYNCLVVKSEMKDVQKRYFQNEELVVVDEASIKNSLSSYFYLRIVEHLNQFKSFLSNLVCCLFQNCINAYCPLCQLDSKVLQVKVRGLCSQSIFNSVYTVTLSDTGNIYYLGDKTSSIKFDKIQQNWQWLDQKNNRSIAIRQGNKIMKYCQLENKLLGSTSKESFKIIILSSLNGELS